MLFTRVFLLLAVAHASGGGAEEEKSYKVTRRPDVIPEDGSKPQYLTVRVRERDAITDGFFEDTDGFFEDTFWVKLDHIPEDEEMLINLKNTFREFALQAMVDLYGMTPRTLLAEDVIIVGAKPYDGTELPADAALGHAILGHNRLRKAQAVPATALGLPPLTNGAFPIWSSNAEEDEEGGTGTWQGEQKSAEPDALDEQKSAEPDAAANLRQRLSSPAPPPCAVVHPAR